MDGSPIGGGTRRSQRELLRHSGLAIAMGIAIACLSLSSCGGDANAQGGDNVAERTGHEHAGHANNC